MEGLRHKSLRKPRAGTSASTAGGSSQGTGGGSTRRSLARHGDQPSERNNQRSNSGGIAAERNDQISNSDGIAVRRNNSQGTDSVGNGDLGTNSGGGIDSVRTKRTVETRGRRKRSRTELRNPLRGRKVVLIPQGDLTKMENHIRQQHEQIIMTRLATKESHVQTDLKKEFWVIRRLFTVANEHKRGAARVLENYCKKRVRNIMYQVRVDAVKLHFENQGEILDETLACRRELNENEYLNARVEWCKEDVWPLLAAYWDSDEFKEKRSKAQDSRLSNEDVAQNRGGSRPFVETQQFIEAVHGPEKATILNAYAVMKSGAKNINSNGSSGVIPSQKAQKRMRDYQEGVEAAHPDDPEQPEVDGHVLYTKGGGLPHGRLIIGDGAMRKEDVIAAAKGKKSRPSSSDSYQHLSEENHELRRANEGLTQHNGAPGSSHASSQSIHNDGMDGATTSANGNNRGDNMEINDTAISLNNNRGDNVAGENGSDDDTFSL
ncbi:hypothetical protein BRADI_2g04729v3 [Brachypodium distachyon]|uniref:Uncharacterized protein n=1 Tax=Brachypodium distachyon TaxID=15368 RepID=A0A0Q3MEY1_BRADI|nr:hypothetical protein BRADI_2g04729v3 [Brachypodium distachyon]